MEFKVVLSGTNKIAIIADGISVRITRSEVNAVASSYYYTGYICLMQKHKGCGIINSYLT